MSDITQSDDTTRTFVRYTEDLEQPRPDEDETVDKLIKVLRSNNEYAYRKFKHGLRDAHAKSHAILRGEFTVYPNLPEPLAQGLFATPATYPVIARLSTTAGSIRSDQIRGVHGLGLKVLGVHGERLLPDDDSTNQDFVLVTHRQFPFADMHAYLVRGMPTAWLLARMSDPVLKFVTDLLAATGKALSRVHLELPTAVEVFTPPNTNILGDTFYSAAPLRWGDYVAKVEYVPVSESVKALQGQLLSPDSGPDAYRHMLAEFFTHNGAEYELRAQLCTDVEAMPIEDATVAWDEVQSPHRGVAKITFPAQDPYSPQRQEFGDDVLSFNSWRALAAHRPLGSINRLKRRVYDASSDFRHQKNQVARLEPAEIAQLPD